MSFPENLPQPHRSKWLKLSEKREEKFREIVSLLTQAYADPAVPRLGTDISLEEEAEELTEMWDEAGTGPVPSTSPSIQAKLQRLLKEHLELGKQKLDIADLVVGD